MENVLKGLNPELVFNYFEEISQIPRGSGNEKAISDYLKKFGEDLGLETIQDDALNIIIRKPATKGYENCPGVILQGHMDMVCEKNKNTEHDFTKDPIKLRIEDDMIYATGTTLGADNGIAVAMGMAVLASNDLAHPQIEVLITSDEEAGMSGAMALDGSNLKGQYIINLDSEEEGFLLVSCAGGVTAHSKLNAEFTNVDANKQALLVDIKGLLGGHSGMDIIKQRANSNILMGRLLNSLCVDFDLAKVEGGSKNNAIPRECEAVIVVDKNDVEKAMACIKEMENTFIHEFASSDPDIVVECKETTVEKVLTNDCKNNVIRTLNLIPNGIQTMSMDIEGLVESSTNLGVVRTLENEVTFECAVRSSVTSLKENITNKMNLLSQTLGGEFTLESDYPAWEYAKGSKLEDICVHTYEKLNGKKPIIKALHAGLECGLLLDKMPHAQAISFGPNMFEVHTPNEHLSISSTTRTWEYLVAILKSMNEHN
ncbi:MULTISPECIES: aminoacyl-histidine dipeptidase [Romboutsia]|uniref:Cytosol non-specific dipeptidase n=1 Tax=Romboutsia hominis TaxID=1507512 RepID=A0A2P2BUG7_9FIRM|nr:MULTISPECIES: aminoacyl-histidine dipeptidase [Romboutsia]MCH1959173.1 aminoacyl-histidine dipeptidase [Romboutsia hominis]MCH1968293.1 aminoacyl-histidine dipeptidase [Romboutsia hominis]MDB8789538.1 aminoacyl-histidine dipeptidase [Romboutsia sp. 1001216sp1]MDB8802681.1 aminoacyl-histidine dipeptidase [Romboutsia sp. 1001216sp1]MDB8805501.1 aminoacyl-histidine dipeptidase [Romboutsia sp. 1001216sp1]